ncbi:ATPase inhibitor mai-2, mitochondrial-like isoform X3 [Mytilus galloprovincialis]|uniref:ATPase inhibitor mai-2, mitochondrial-like isoform X1 n=1 Tax=Mytilus trossulus TaxID=6551 RepID=UPI00300430A7
MALQAAKRLTSLRFIGIRAMSDEWGSGAGKGGGAGGSVREAGGAFGKMEAAREEQYFRKLQAQQLKEMKDHLDEEVNHHEVQIKQHQEAIDRHKKRITDLAKAEKKTDGSSSSD